MASRFFLVSSNVRSGFIDPFFRFSYPHNQGLMLSRQSLNLGALRRRQTPAIGVFESQTGIEVRQQQPGIGLQLSHGPFKAGQILGRLLVGPQTAGGAP